MRSCISGDRSEELENNSFHQCLVGGFSNTSARINGALRIRDSFLACKLASRILSTGFRITDLKFLALAIMVVTVTLGMRDGSSHVPKPSRKFVLVVCVIAEVLLHVLTVSGPQSVFQYSKLVLKQFRNLLHQYVRIKSSQFYDDIQFLLPPPRCKNSS